MLKYTAILALIATQSVADEITVFAASSLKNVLDEIVTTYQAEHTDTVLVSYAGSSTLARQIQAGAPADVFISANGEWVDYLDPNGRTVTNSRQIIAGNELVLIGHSAGAVAVDQIAAALGDGIMAMAMIDSVPAGIYGKQALTTLGQWDVIAPHVAQTDNVRAALNLVALGEADFGIVYATDAAADPRVSVAATFPNDSHDPITYPAVLITDAVSTQAFLSFLTSPAGQSIFAKYGFSPAPK